VNFILLELILDEMIVISHSDKPLLDKNLIITRFKVTNPKVLTQYTETLNEVFFYTHSVIAYTNIVLGN